MLAAVEAVQAVQEARRRLPPELLGKGIYSSQTIWHYQLEEGVNNCEHCKELGGREFLGNDIRSRFPDHIVYSENIIWVNLHQTLWGKDTCCKKGTLVNTDKGLKPIEEVTVGDLVLTHKGRYRKVTQIHINNYNGSLYNFKDIWLTKNHPVLTLRGWVNAEFLNESDYLVNIKSMAFTEAINMPALSFQESSFLSVSSPHLIVSMSGYENIVSSASISSWSNSAVDLYGYSSGGDCKVNIENVDSIQGYNCYPLFAKSIEKNSFKFTKFSRLLNLFGAVYKKIVSYRAFPHALVVRFNLLLSLLKCHVLPLQKTRFTATPYGHICAYQTSPNSSSVYTETFSNNLFTNSRNVEVNDLFCWQMDSQGLLTQGTLPISNIYNEQFKGLVYNLSVEEDETFCLGIDKIVVHNCKCFLYRAGMSALDLDLFQANLATITGENE